MADSRAMVDFDETSSGETIARSELGAGSLSELDLESVAEADDNDDTSKDGKETLEVKVEDKVDDSKLLVKFKSAKAKDVGYPNVGTKEVIGIFLR